MIAPTLTIEMVIQQTDRIIGTIYTECGTKRPQSNRMSIIGEGIGIIYSEH